VLSAYSLGKAQRVLANLDKTIGPIYVHPSIMRVCEVLEFSLDGLRCEPLTELSRAQSPLVVVPPAVLNSSWMMSCHPCRTASVSGWMAIRGMKRRRGVDRGFVLSDHADFNGLHQAISATGASTVYLTHGYTAAFARWLSERYPSLCVRELQIERGRQDQEEE